MLRAVEGMEAEVWVIDNCSTDGSRQYFEGRFPGVGFIYNTENTGFARANNQALEHCSGRYILFLNPDTLVPEDCFRKSADFLDQHPDAGALGVRMIDGSGRFLKESKRAFPSPLTSFFKLVGLARLFPASSLFARYHLGHLDEHTNHEVDVLAGAFMMVRKEITDRIGCFDEQFFMYGEDVDLSFRIQKAGYKNYYFAGSTIVHFKGESTRKGSLNYVRLFYKAMSIFVRKHYGGSKAGIFNFFIQAAILMRALVSAIGQFIRRIGLPVIDAGFIFLSFWLMKAFWNTYIKTDVVYPMQLIWIAFPLFTLIYLITAYFAGLYDRFYKQSELNRSTLIATITLLALYSMLPEQYRFSRGIILFGALLSYVFISLLRWLLVNWGFIEWRQENGEKRQTVIAGSAGAFHTVSELMQKAGLHERIIGRIGVDENEEAALGHFSQLPALAESLPVQEIIFCQGDTLSYQQILEQMPLLPQRIKLKFHAAGSLSIVGSNSKDSAGETLSPEKEFRLARPANLRLKRLADLGLSLVFLLSFPVHFFTVKKPFRFLGQAFQVLVGRKTWVGYAGDGLRLPRLKPGVLATNGSLNSEKGQLSLESRQMLDYWYARDYEAITDLRLVGRAYRRLGN